jgi:transaldolase/glucose-6-phosphate isomerase
MIKVPGRRPGITAFRRLTRDGVSVNVTLLFSADRYRAIAEAYIDALEERHAAGEPIDAIASVASFFVSRIDTKVDEQLPEDSPLRGKVAVANAKLAYADVFQQVFAGGRWDALTAAGANVQRPLWASTGVKNPAYSPTLYIDSLIGPDTVNTVPDVALEAFRDRGTPGETVTEGVDEARGSSRLPSSGRRPGGDHRRPGAGRRQAVLGRLRRHARGHRVEAAEGLGRLAHVIP